MSTDSSPPPTTSAHSDPSPPQSHQSSPESSSEPPQTITMSDNQAAAHSQDDLQSGSKSPSASDPSSSSSSSGEPTLVKGSHSASAERIEAGSSSKSMDYTNNNNSSTGISGSNNSNAQSLSVPGNGSTTEKGGKTSQRKNVQWAASTKGEGPMRGDPGPSSSAYVPNYTGNGPQGRNSWYDIRNGGGYTYGYGYGGANNGYARGREKENNASASLSQPRSVHHLDSAGLDPEAFKELTHALERHQSDSTSAVPSSSVNPTVANTVANKNSSSGLDLSSLPSSSISRPQGGLSGRRPPPRLTSLPPNPFSSTSTAMMDDNSHNASGNGKEYDPSTSYALNPFSPVFTPRTLSPIHSDNGSGGNSRDASPTRVIPGEVIIEPMETAGLPEPIRSVFEPGKEVDGEGLENEMMAEEQKKRFQRRASELVRVHARGGFQVLAGFKGNKATAHMLPEDIDQEAPPRRVSRASKRRSKILGSIRRKFRESRAAKAKGTQESPEDEKETESVDEKEDEEEDLEGQKDDVPVGNPPLALGSGVLGALLTLYNSQRPGFATPGDRTPSGSEPPTPTYERFDQGRDYFGRNSKSRERKERRDAERGRQLESAREREREEWRERQEKLDGEKGDKRTSEDKPFVQTPLNAPPPSESINLSRQTTRQSQLSEGGSPARTPPYPFYAQKSGTRSLQSLREPIQKISSSLNLPTFMGGDGRPAQARNGGGVFGSLIASTGNIAGVAAPHQARIAPNTKRPGYHLSRYSVEEIPSRKAGKGSGASTPSSISPSGLILPGSDPKLTAGGSRSAPATPLKDIMDIPAISLQGTSGQGSPMSHDISPASETPLMMAGSRHPKGSKSLDGLTLADTNDIYMKGGHVRTASDTQSLGLTVVPTRDSEVTTHKGSGGKKKWAGILKDFPRSYSSGTASGWSSIVNTPGTENGSYSEPGGDYWDEKQRRAVTNAANEEKKKKKRKKAEIYITRHVAEVLSRQEFILKLARAFMMFGAPSHRLPAQIQATARVLDIELSCMYLPDVMLISFDDASTSTSNIKFIRQGAALNLGRLQDAYDLYWKVIHDEISVNDASHELDTLMRGRPAYRAWQLALFGGFCSAAICVVSFSGSFIDALISFPLGFLLVIIQILSVRNELYSNVFEITVATLLSFLAAVFAGTQCFCYSAVASGSIVLILPGFLVLNGSLELSSRNIVSGAVRLCYAIMYALFLGFGLSIGGTLYETITGKSVLNPEDYTCSYSHNADGPWYQRTPSEFWSFLTVPMFSLFLSLRNHANYKRKELLITVIIACIGWTCNHFSAVKFPSRSDVSSAIGAFAVGFIANLYGRFFKGNAFVIMITGILFQLPSGLGNGGLITFASQNNSSGSSTSYLSGFRTALQLISVSVGLTVGLGISLVVIFPIQSRKRAGGIFSL